MLLVVFATAALAISGTIFLESAITLNDMCQPEHCDDQQHVVHSVLIFINLSEFVTCIATLFVCFRSLGGAVAVHKAQSPYSTLIIGDFRSLHRPAKILEDARLVNGSLSGSPFRPNVANVSWSNIHCMKAEAVHAMVLFLFGFCKGVEEAAHQRRAASDQELVLFERQLTEFGEQKVTVIPHYASSKIYCVVVFLNFSSEKVMDQRQVIFKEIDNLKQVLPVSSAILEQQDRTSVLRVASIYLSIRNYFTQDLGKSCRDNIETTSLILQALDGFCFILDDRFRILYITESVSTHLGFSQVQMVGCCMSEFVHPEDFSVLNHVMTINMEVPQSYTHKMESTTQFTLRMTSKLPKRSCGFMFAGYKVPLNSQQFLLRTTPDLSIVFCDSRVGEILGFNPIDLLDRTLYHLITVEDTESLLRAHMMKRPTIPTTSDHFPKVRDENRGLETGKPPELDTISTGLLQAGDHYLQAMLGKQMALENRPDVQLVEYF
ncbi:unnamed protein product [Angiostrongylus costaricensis]|uniref:PAS domain-containing protein n=1 Tax=Angiostrongylus costaricensis TaxID=334426 RepID=A0A158PIT7_ANGCS|nr:unnamed protein product [Angiostrongylus costaricensis]